MTIINLVIFFFLIALTTVFVGSEFALVKVRTTRIEQLATEGNGSARVVKKMIKNLDYYLSACQLGITVTSLGLGWLGVTIIYPLLQTIEITGIALLAIGGIVYSLGTIFYSMKNNKWMHIIWHLFVMAGAFFMYISVLFYV